MLHLRATRQVSTLGTACPHPVGGRGQWMAEGCLRHRCWWCTPSFQKERWALARQCRPTARTTTPVATALKRVCADAGENGRVLSKPSNRCVRTRKIS